MTLTETEIKSYIWSLTIRTYHKINMFILLRDYYGFKNIHKIEIFRYGDTFDIHLRYGGVDVFWEERSQVLDRYKTSKRKYKFRQQIYKNINNFPKNTTNTNEIVKQANNNLQLLINRLN